MLGFHNDLSLAVVQISNTVLVCLFKRVTIFSINNAKSGAMIALCSILYMIYATSLFCTSDLPHLISHSLALRLLHQPHLLPELA